MKINFDKSVFNDNFYPLLFDKSRYLFLMGGAGSGKSYFAAYKILYRMLSENNNRFLFVRAVKDSIRNSMYKLFKDIIHAHNLENLFEYRETDMYIRCPQTSSEIICVGLNDVERLKSIADPTSIWIEEATEVDKLDFIQLNLRVRGTGGNYRQSIMTFNPISENHWIREEYFPIHLDEKLFNDNLVRWIKKVKLKDGRKADIDITLHRSTAYQNKFVDPEYIAGLEDIKNRDYNYWQVYANAKWGTIGNLVFPEPFPTFERYPSSLDDIIYGLDFGFHNPSALVEIGIKDDVYYVKEKFYGKGYTNRQLIELFQKNALIEPGASIYPDPAEPARIKDFLEHGFNMQDTYRSNDSVAAGYDLLKSLKIYIHKNSVNLLRETRCLKYEEDENHNPIEGKILRVNDHCLSAMRYAIYTYNTKGQIYIGFIE